MIYFDTSYVAKCYLNETGSSSVRQLAQSQSTLACCEYGRIEVMSTFHRNLREGMLTKSQYDVVARQFENDDKNGIWTWLPLTADLCRKTAARIYALPLAAFIRAGDALHLTSAAENGFAEIYSNDRHLQASAALFGLEAVNVIRWQASQYPLTAERLATRICSPSSRRSERKNQELNISTLKSLRGT